jgi:molybdopterin-containing oxidoreductase family iron-sulfur binding subunit
MARYAMLIDMTRCIGCDACTVACKQENGTPVDTFFARVLNIETGKYPNVKRIYLPVLCNHCDDAPCLKACPNKAIFRRDDGIVLIDQDRCKGTGACVSACPYGNVYLYKQDHWYLNEDEPYERDFVKPRLNENVARKCTYCAHRVDEGLDPACVVACPTTARIFGDTEDPNSVVSQYIVEQKQETRREPFYLLPEAKTKPATMYLGTMSNQEVQTMGNRAEAGEPSKLVRGPQNAVADKPEAAKAVPARFQSRRLKLLPMLLGLLALLIPALALAQDTEINAVGLDTYAASACAGCHGGTGADGFAPSIANTALTEEEFLAVVRDGTAMMTPTSADEMGDDVVSAMYSELQVVEPAPATDTDDDPEPAVEMTAVEGLDAYLVSSCVGCHGQTAMGNSGPPIAGTQMTEEEFLALVREGKGMMTGTPESMLDDEAVSSIWNELQATEKDDSQIPIAYKVGRFLSQTSVGHIFMTVTVLSLIFTILVLRYWVGNSGLKMLKPAIKAFGTFKAWGIFLKALIVEGFLVSSLWKKSKHRWFMHGLLLYGFCGLMLADILMAVFNPLRAELALTHPLKLFPVVCGGLIFIGVCYVMYRYKVDEYVDNGHTLGRDFLFVNLILHAIVSGFIVVLLKRTGVTDWTMTIYLYHLTTIAVLMLTWPFTRGAHVFIVPVLVGITRVTEAVAESGVDLGFEREPSPGRHHKSQRIAEQVIGLLEPGEEGSVKLRYYP